MQRRFALIKHDHALADLSDVLLTDPQDGQVLTYDTSIERWINADSAGGGGTIQVDDEGSTVVAAATILNFVGSPVTVTDAGGGEATITITANTGIPLNTQTGNYTLVLGDAGYCIYRDSGSAATWTIPANGSVAFPTGTVVMFNNRDADTNITIAITTDTLVYTPGGATGSRTLVPNGRAFAHKVTSTLWEISGTGIF